MKIAVSFLVLSLFANLTIAQTTAIPDTNFEKKLIALGYDTGSIDGIIPTANIDTISILFVDRSDIISLKGIEDFKALTSLYCQSNRLTSLDVTQNASLMVLHCHSNKLASLDVTQNAALISLHCYWNPLTSLDVTQNMALMALNCDNNQLTSLDLTKNTSLNWVFCRHNQLTSIDLTENTSLITLVCSNNQLTSLDLTKNTSLNTLVCGDNQLTSLDVSQNSVLNFLVCENNELTKLDVTKNTSLTELGCGGNRLTSLDLTKNTSLITLVCSNNQLTSLDLTKNTSLTNLGCRGNQLTSLNLKNGNNTNLQMFQAKYNPDLSCIEVDNVAYSVSNWTDIDVGTLFSINCSNPGNVGIKDKDIRSSQIYTIYPNPTTGTIYMDTYQSTKLSATLRNSLGQIISTQEFEPSENVQININTPNGIYFLSLETPMGISRTVKVIKE
ncbi:MAG: hypothetical protein CL840_19045 [Crocinitomicaceae bacterium]|nr:hypothetical protein [Crocinitomicaceae bacterium]|tara:strand:- start:8409 stop:9737 length:1329 start_codon:yes stop_codon:yes gene_type:complete